MKVLNLVPARRSYPFARTTGFLWIGVSLFLTQSAFLSANTKHKNKWETYASALEFEQGRAKFGKHEDSRYHLGFTNFGNTCFLNGAMHLLATDPQFQTFLAGRPVRGLGTPTPESRLAKRLHHHLRVFVASVRGSQQAQDKAKHFHRLNRSLKVIIREYEKLHLLRYGVPSERIPGNQQDPQEFIQKLFDLLGYQKRQGFTLADTLQWDYELESRQISQTRNSILSLSILQDNTTPVRSVQEAADDFFKREALIGSAANNYAPGYKQTRILNAPPSLIVQLKRYQVDYFTGSLNRVHSPVAVTPITIDIFNEEGRLIQKAIYNPEAVEVHQAFGGGSIQSGHYYTYVTHPKGWVCHDDAKIPGLQANAQRDIDLNAYLILYKLSSLSEVATPKPPRHLPANHSH